MKCNVHINVNRISNTHKCCFFFINLLNCKYSPVADLGTKARKKSERSEPEL